ncbi:MAG TPA: SMI1/KNR4 family protein [Planctomycetota bacterium]
MHESMKDLPIGELLAYYARRRAGFAERAKGAGEEEIREFERLVGRPLPEDYLVFLRAAGRDCGDMFKGESKAYASDGSFTRHPHQYDFSLETAVKERRRLKAKVAKNPRLAAKPCYNPAFVMIGTQSHCQDCGSYFLDLRAPGTSPVVNIEDLHELRVVAPSFRDFLFRFAFAGERF